MEGLPDGHNDYLETPFYKRVAGEVKHSRQELTAYKLTTPVIKPV